jgi:hypothetical protein
LGRAPSTWTDANIELIKKHFIAAAVPTELCRMKCPEGEFLRSAGIDKHWVTSSGYFDCVAPSGKWLGHIPSEKVLEAFRTLPEAERKPGAIKVPDLESHEKVIVSPPAGGLVLRVHGRFLARDDRGGLRPVTQADFPRSKSDLRFLLEPNTEYLWLTAQECQALVPTDPVKGQKIPVATALSERIARFHLSPRRALTSEDGIVPKNAIKKAELSLIVDEVSEERIRLGLEGFIHWGSDYDAAKATTPNGPLPFGYAAPIHGILEYDRAKKAFVRFDVVAPGDVWGRWGDANGNSQTVERAGRTPIGFAFELAQGDSPTNRLPPAGHGARALRAGYFGAAK